MRSLLARLAAAALVAAAAVVALPVGPVAASYCSSGGVGVLVDATAMGAGSQQECGPGPKASNAFKDDFTLTGYRGDPAYVCQIDGLPTDGDCRQTDAYWALFVSRDGGAWTYATQGAYSLDVADGDSVAFVWQDSASRRVPGTAPAPPAPSSAPTQASPTGQPSSAPTRRPGSQPTRQPSRTPTTRPPAPTSTPTADPTSSATPTTSPTAKPGKRPGQRDEKDVTSLTPSPTAPSATPSGTPTAKPSDEPTLSPAADEPTDAEEGGLPAWFALAALALVAGGTGAVLVRRRRSNPGP